MKKNALSVSKAVVVGGNKKTKTKTMKISKPKNKTTINVESLDASFTQIQQTKMTKIAAQQRKAARMVPMGEKLVVPSRETVARTGDELAQLLKYF